MHFRTWFCIPTYYYSLGYRKLSQRLHVLLLWWSGTVITALSSLKSGFREYISPRMNFRLYSTLAEKWAGQHWITKISSDHEIFITKIYFNANLERFTKFLNHENLELYGMPTLLWGATWVHWCIFRRLHRVHVPLIQQEYTYTKWSSNSKFCKGFNQ